MDASDLTTQDRFLDGRLTLRQLSEGPRTAIDAFFLAAAIPAVEGRNEHVLDAGTGNGAAGLALCSRVVDVRVTGIEIQKTLLELANENARQNGLADRFSAVGMDILQGMNAFEAAGLKRESFHHVAANPPYQDAGSSRVSDNPVTARAYSALPGELEKWLDVMLAMTAPGGTITIIHRADALNTLLTLLEGRAGHMGIFPLFPKSGAPAKRLLIQGVKGSRAPLRLLSGMVLHEADGAYTSAANAVLRNASAIDLGIT